MRCGRGCDKFMAYSNTAGQGQWLERETTTQLPALQPDPLARLPPSRA